MTSRKNSKLASGIVMTLLYCQGLLGFAGVATVVLKARVHTEVAYQAKAPAETPTIAAL